MGDADLLHTDWMFHCNLPSTQFSGSCWWSWQQFNCYWRLLESPNRTGSTWVPLQNYEAVFWSVLRLKSEPRNGRQTNTTLTVAVLALQPAFWLSRNKDLITPEVEQQRARSIEMPSTLSRHFILHWLSVWVHGKAGTPFSELRGANFSDSLNIVFKVELLFSFLK